MIDQLEEEELRFSIIIASLIGGLIYSLEMILFLLILFDPSQSVTEPVTYWYLRVMSAVLGYGFLFSTISSIIAGLVGGLVLCIDDIDERRGLIAGIGAAITGNFMFPFLGAIFRDVYFQDASFLFMENLAYLSVYSIIGILPCLTFGTVGGFAAVYIVHKI